VTIFSGGMLGAGGFGVSSILGGGADGRVGSGGIAAGAGIGIGAMGTGSGFFFVNQT